MAKRYIMTAFGKDRPGIVADVTKILFENGCNLEETSMTLLADEFTLILLFSSQRQDLEELLQMECRRLEREKAISAFLRPLAERSTPGGDEKRSCVVHVEGMDQAGIVYRVSEHMAAQKVNIVDLQSTVKASPESGSAIYVMDITTQLPAGMTPGKMEEGLREVADELHVDITLT